MHFFRTARPHYFDVACRTGSTERGAHAINSESGCRHSERLLDGPACAIDLFSMQSSAGNGCTEAALQPLTDQRPLLQKAAGECEIKCCTIIDEQLACQRPHVQGEFLNCHVNDSVRAHVALHCHRKYGWGERCERFAIRCDSPRNKLLDFIYLRGGQNRAGQRRFRLAPVMCGCYNAQRASADPRAAPLVAKRYSPSTAPAKYSGWTAAVGNRTRAGNEQYSRTIAKCIGKRDARIGLYNDLIRDFAV